MWNRNEPEPLCRCRVCGRWNRRGAEDIARRYGAAKIENQIAVSITEQRKQHAEAGVAEGERGDLDRRNEA